MERLRDPKSGRFISATAQAMLEQSRELEEKAQQLIAAENTPPSWLKDVVIAFTSIIGITPEEFEAQVKVIHPTSHDPVLLMRGNPIISWI